MRQSSSYGVPAPGNGRSVPPASMLFVRRPGSNGPVPVQAFGSDRLAVVVRVEHHRARGAGRGEFGEDDRSALRNVEEPHAEAAPLEHGLEPIGVPADVGLVRRDIGNRQQVDEFLDDRLLVRHTVRANRCGDIRGGWRALRRPEAGDRRERDPQGQLMMPVNAHSVPPPRMIADSGAIERDPRLDGPVTWLSARPARRRAPPWTRRARRDSRASRWAVSPRSGARRSASAGPTAQASRRSRHPC